MLTGNLLQKVSEMTAGLPKSERRVAEYVVAQRSDIPQMSIAALALAASVSEPTVLRFCRSMGCEGFPAFKIHLAQSLVSGGAHIHHAVLAEDTVQQAIPKIFNTTIGTLAHVRDTLDHDRIEQAVEALAQARKVEFYGVGASGAVAIDAQHKFFRLDVPSIAYVDSHMQVMSAATLRPEDVLVAFSHTGRSASIVDSARLAVEAGATVIGVTLPGSPLAALSSIALEINAPEDTDIYTPMASRIAHLVVVDVLAAGVAMRRGPELAQNLRRMKSSIGLRRLPGKEAGPGTQDTTR